MDVGRAAIVLAVIMVVPDAKDRCVVEQLAIAWMVKLDRIRRSNLFWCSRDSPIGDTKFYLISIDVVSQP